MLWVRDTRWPRKWVECWVTWIINGTLDPKHFSFPQLVLAEIYQRKNDSVSLMRELQEFLKFHPDSKRVPELTEWLERTRSNTESALLEAATR